MSFATPSQAGSLSREQTAVAYEKHHVAKGNYSGEWGTLADHFAEDAAYYDVFYGWQYGRPAIRAFLINAMKGIEDWSFPVQWQVVSEGRVIAHWMNRLPGKRPDGTYFEFPGVSVITYNAKGEIIEQMDIYNGISAIKVVTEARTGVLGRAFFGLFGWLGTVGREGMRLVYTVFGGKK